MHYTYYTLYVVSWEALLSKVLARHYIIVRKPTSIISQDLWWDITWCNVNIVPEVL